MGTKDVFDISEKKLAARLARWPGPYIFFGFGVWMLTSCLIWGLCLLIPMPHRIRIPELVVPVGGLLGPLLAWRIVKRFSLFWKIRLWTFLAYLHLMLAAAWAMSMLFGWLWLWIAYANEELLLSGEATAWASGAIVGLLAGIPWARWYVRRSIAQPG